MGVAHADVARAPCENLFTWTRLRLYDPEAVGNFENWGPGKTYPQYRTYSIGLDVTF